MPVQAVVKAEVRKARRFYKEVGRTGINRATARAINDTTRTVRKEGAQRIKAHHKALKIGDIKREMKTQKAYPNRLTGWVRTTGKPLSLLLFKAKELKKGVKATIGNKRGLVTYKGRKAFIVHRYGGEVFVRRDATGRRIRRYRGPSLPGVFRAQIKAFKAIAAERFPKVFKSRMDFQIDKAARRARLGSR